MIDVMNENKCFDGDIQIIQSVSSSKDNYLNDQDGLYHVITKGLDSGKVTEHLRLISCVRGTINAQEEQKRFLEISAYESLQFVVSNTTEAGICFEEEAHEEGKIPKSFPGKLTVLLHERFKKRLNPLIILPCELIEDNGDTLRGKVLQYATYWGLSSAFSDWVRNENIFCNTLVDRIVPGGSNGIIEEIQRTTGVLDKMAVMVEPYYFWAIDAPAVVQQRLPADQCGLNVKFTNNLSYYRERKVKILNGAHTALTPVAYLRGLRSVKACMSDETIGNFISEVIYKEIVPTLPGDRNELNKFAEQVIDRFKNPFIEHQLLSIALNSISKFRVRILPTILKYYQVNQSLPGGLMRSFAALIVFYRGHWKQEEIKLKDQEDVLTFFREAWRENGVASVAQRVLGNEQLWGLNLSEIAGMSANLSAHLTSILSEE
jgi:tagaturonate reductase